MKKNLLAAVALAMFAPALHAADYGLPSGIQEGNILHCFDWTIAQVKADLQNIANAGYGSVQLSPLQRSDARVGWAWHDLYRPYDLAFKGGLGTETELKELCSEASKYGIKVIVDVVANHVDKTAGYHDPWWDSNGRVRWEGGINYGNRYSITHGQLGDYGDVNSESSEVQARGKAYVEKLKECGVKGIRWDAAKHIGLPSEGCNFWSTVTSVPGMYHYGEILNDDGTPINEYAKYMSVTDNRYSNSAAKDNGGIPSGYAGDWVANRGVADTKVVYWGESHDTYCNDEWSQNVDQSVIDRAYASMACRNGATALYFARPDAKGFNNIKIGKGNSTAYRSKAISCVNKFRNLMVGKADYFSAQGNAISVTRQGGGAVIVMKGSGSVSVPNGGGYCPAGEYTDQVSGGKFTVNASTISGNVGSSGIAVLVKDGTLPNPNPNPDPDPDPTPNPGSDLWIIGNLSGAAGWSSTPGTGVKMTANGNVYTAKNVTFTLAAGETVCYFNLTDYVGATWDDLNISANRYGSATEGEAVTLGTPATIVKYANNVNASGCLSWTVPAGTYDITADLSTMKLTVVNAGTNPDPDPNPNPNPTPGSDLWVLGNLSGAAGWGTTPGTGVKMTANGNVYTAKNVTFTLAAGESKCYFNLTDYVGATWDDLNISANRYGSATEGEAVTLGTPATIVKYANNVNASGCLSWTVPAGTYDITADLSTMKLTVVNAGTNPDPDPNPNPDPNPGAKFVIYFDNSDGWASPAPYIYAWTSNDVALAGTWPGSPMTLYQGSMYKWECDEAPYGVIFTNGNGVKAGGASGEAGAGDLINPESGSIYNSANQHTGQVDGVLDIATETEAPAEYYNLNGVRVFEPTPGIYIMRQGSKVSKVVVR